MKSCAAVLLAAGAAQAADYAVLAATSNSYGNYRHQADVSHAYQVLTKGGIPAENIITFMYDDIAHNSQNPFPGKIFNKPTKAGVPGVDVYAGVKIDYKGSEVSSKNFLSVLTGDASAMKGKGTGRVLKSTSKDRVFVNVVDHGAPGLVAFPNDMLYKEDLTKALKEMQSKKMYKQLVFYLEACESGSMFEDLPTNMNIYATTAANAQESSWGTYCGSDAMVDGKNVGSCLGDLYSVNWMQNADASNLMSETLEAQYTAVKKLTDKSHVMQYGELSLDSLPAGDFEGSEKKNVTEAADGAAASRGAVASRDVAIAQLFHKYVSTRSSAAAAALVAEIKEREAVDAKFAAISAQAAAGRVVKENAPLVARGCHKAADAAVKEFCGGYSDYSLRHVRTMIDTCEAVSGDASTVVAAVRAVCGH